MQDGVIIEIDGRRLALRQINAHQLGERRQAGTPVEESWNRQLVVVNPGPDDDNEEEKKEEEQEAAEVAESESVASFHSRFAVPATPSPSLAPPAENVTEHEGEDEGDWEALAPTTPLLPWGTRNIMPCGPLPASRTPPPTPEEHVRTNSSSTKCSSNCHDECGGLPSSTAWDSGRTMAEKFGFGVGVVEEGEPERVVKEIDSEEEAELKLGMEEEEEGEVGLEEKEEEVRMEEEPVAEMEEEEVEEMEEDDGMMDWFLWDEVARRYLYRRTEFLMF